MEWDTKTTSLGAAYAKADSGKALCIEMANGDEMWVPKSQIHDDSEVYAVGHEGDLVVTDWWATQKGLI